MLKTKIFTNSNHSKIETEINSFLKNIRLEDFQDIKITHDKSAGIIALLLYRAN
jgi:hypothetical protein